MSRRRQSPDPENPESNPDPDRDISHGLKSRASGLRLKFQILDIGIDNFVPFLKCFTLEPFSIFLPLRFVFKVLFSSCCCATQERKREERPSCQNRCARGAREEGARNAQHDAPRAPRARNETAGGRRPRPSLRPRSQCHCGRPRQDRSNKSRKCGEFLS